MDTKVTRSNTNLNSDVISRREAEILKLIASGFSSDEIGKKLFISVHTVISHRKNLITKLHAKNSAHLIALAFRGKIIHI